MKRLLLAPILALGLLASGCDEHYERVNANQVVLFDDDGSIDGNNIRTACDRYGLDVLKVEGSGTSNDRPVLITCGRR